MASILASCGVDAGASRCAPLLAHFPAGGRGAEQPGSPLALVQRTEAFVSDGLVCVLQPAPAPAPAPAPHLPAPARAASRPSDEVRRWAMHREAPAPDSPASAARLPRAVSSGRAVGRPMRKGLFATASGWLKMQAGGAPPAPAGDAGGAPRRAASAADEGGWAVNFGERAAPAARGADAGAEAREREERRGAARSLDLGGRGGAPGQQGALTLARPGAAGAGAGGGALLSPDMDAGAREPVERSPREGEVPAAAAGGCGFSPGAGGASDAREGPPSTPGGAAPAAPGPSWDSMPTVERLQRVAALARTPKEKLPAGRPRPRPAPIVGLFGAPPPGEAPPEPPRFDPGSVHAPAGEGSPRDAPRTPGSKQATPVGRAAARGRAPLSGPGSPARSVASAPPGGAAGEAEAAAPSARKASGASLAGALAKFSMLLPSPSAARAQSQSLLPGAPAAEGQGGQGTIAEGQGGQGTIEVLMKRAGTPRADGQPMAFGRSSQGARAAPRAERFDNAGPRTRRKAGGGRAPAPAPAGDVGGASPAAPAAPGGDGDDSSSGGAGLGELVGGSAWEEEVKAAKVRLFRFLRRRFQTAPNLFHLLLSTRRQPAPLSPADAPAPAPDGALASPGGAPGGASSTVSVSGSDAAATRVLFPGAAGTAPLSPPMAGPGGNVVPWEAFVAAVEGLEGCPAAPRELRAVARGMADHHGLVAFRDLQAALREAPSEGESRRAAAAAAAREEAPPRAASPGGASEGGDAAGEAAARRVAARRERVLGQLRETLRGVWGSAWEAFVWFDLRQADGLRRADVRQGLKRLAARGALRGAPLDADAVFDALDVRSAHSDALVPALHFARLLSPGWHELAAGRTLDEHEAAKARPPPPPPPSLLLPLPVSLLYTHSSPP